VYETIKDWIKERKGIEQEGDFPKQYALLAGGVIHNI
jgi:hypothetical protein